MYLRVLLHITKEPGYFAAGIKYHLYLTDKIQRMFGSKMGGLFLNKGGKCLKLKKEV